VTATGFAVTKYLWPAEYRGLGGVTIEDYWKAGGAGPRAYLGLTVPQFPNLFIMYGPNSQCRAGSLISWFEIWAAYAAQSVVHMLENGQRRMVVMPEVFETYNRDMDAACEHLIWYDPVYRAKNYYSNEHGRQEVSVPWRVDLQYEYLARMKPAD